MGDRRQSGFTVLEVLIASTILVVLVGAAVYSILLGQKTTNEGMKRSAAQQNVLQALGAMLPEIRQSGSTTSGSGIAVGPNAAGVAGKKLTFRKNTGFDGAAIVWSDPMSFEWRAASPDGWSRNVILRADPSGATTAVAAGIDPGFGFALESGGDQVTISIASTVALDDGATARFAATEVVLLRN